MLQQNMYKIDYHLHTDFSADSNLKLEDLVEAARQNSYDEIAITEHFDFLPSELSEYGLPSLRKYYDKVSCIRGNEDKLKIVFGVELGEYHLNHDLADLVLADYPPELKIASIHVLEGTRNVSVPLNFDLTAKDIRDYYEENLKLVEYGNFNILGHLGIYKRYLTNLPDERNSIDIIKEIFKNLIYKEIALEINYSGLFKPCRTVLPDAGILRLYKEMGGKLITIGSDSHHLRDFNSPYQPVLEIIRAIGFTSVFGLEQSKWIEYRI